MRYSLVLLSICFLLACESEITEPELETGNIPENTNLRVNHYRHPCTGVGNFLCLLIQEDDKIGTEDWNFHYGGVEGFEYQKGFIYNLKVRTENIDNPPADGSSTRVILEEILSKEAVPNDTTFKIRLSRSYSDGGFESFVTGNDTDGFNILGNLQINCGDNCIKLAVKLGQKEDIIGIFKHLDEDTIELIDFE